MRLEVASEDGMTALGARIAAALPPPPAGLVVTLGGPLGAGKTTLVRGLLRALGHAGSVKSPTYTLVESYSVAGRNLHHFDFYRLDGPAALEGLGLRDYLAPDAICLVEWPERGGAGVPVADVHLRILPSGPIREVMFEARTGTGEALLQGLAEKEPSRG